MKKIITIMLVFIVSASFAQDTTKRRHFGTDTLEINGGANIDILQPEGHITMRNLCFGVYVDSAALQHLEAHRIMRYGIIGGYNNFIGNSLYTKYKSKRPFRFKRNQRNSIYIPNIERIDLYGVKKRVVWTKVNGVLISRTLGTNQKLISKNVKIINIY